MLGFMFGVITRGQKEPEQHGLLDACRQRMSLCVVQLKEYRTVNLIEHNGAFPTCSSGGMLLMGSTQFPTVGMCTAGL